MSLGSVIVLPSVRAAVDFCWRLSTYFQSLMEDLEGIDGREAYFESLKIRVIETAFELEDLRAAKAPTGSVHRLAVALENGLRQTAKMKGRDILCLLCDDQGRALMDREEDLRDLCRTVLTCGPGPIPNPFAPSGQRNMLKALQAWSELGADCAEDLSFLAGRLDSL